MGNQVEHWTTSCIRFQGIAIVDSESIDTSEPLDSLPSVGFPVTALVLSIDIVYFTMKPIKIVSYNTYLICNRFNQNRVTHPEQRATKICRDFLSNNPPSRDEVTDTTTIKPDLCFFQEGRKKISCVQDWWSTKIYESLDHHDVWLIPFMGSWLNCFTAGYKFLSWQY